MGWPFFFGLSGVVADQAIALSHVLFNALGAAITSAASGRVGCGSRKEQVPPLRCPGVPVEVSGFGKLHAPFFVERRTRGSCPVLRGRKSGYAPVGMTILLQMELLPRIIDLKIICHS